MISTNILFLLIFSTTLVITVNGLNVALLKECCNLGQSYAANGDLCKNFKTPIQGVKKEEEPRCLHSAEVCCKNKESQLQCEAGKETANNEKECKDSGTKKDCCEACQLGIESGKSGQGCSDSLGLGPPFENAFTSCCEEAQKKTTTQKPTETTKDPDLMPAIPPITDMCDVDGVCAQICIPTEDSYRCDCNKGFSLMADNISCKPDKAPKRNTSNNGSRCDENPCEHECVDTGVAIRCTCRDGFELGKDKRSCKDIDECELGKHDCSPDQECVNDEGSYFCEDPISAVDNNVDFQKCPEGYKFNGEKNVCDDIDECQFGIMCPRPKICINTKGSFECKEGETPNCPPGFTYDFEIKDCADNNECQTEGQNNCNAKSQHCLNTVGSYTCIDKASTQCPAGFKRNKQKQICEDINECEENSKQCKTTEQCVNKEGGYTCVAKKTTTKKPPPPPTTRKPSPTKPTPKKFCPTGFKSSNKVCVDINECADAPCDSNQRCQNTLGSYTCECGKGFTKDHMTGACVDINECQSGAHTCSDAQRCDNTLGSYYCARVTGCGTGYTLNYASGLCEDDDECALGTHKCSNLGPQFQCKNILGSYRCIPTPSKPQTQTQTPRSYSNQRPYYQPVETTTKVPSYFNQRPTTKVTDRPTTLRTTTTQPQPIRTTANPNIYTYYLHRGPTTTVSYPSRSNFGDPNKRCLPGSTMNSRGECEDINECASNPCKRGEACLNLYGRYHCVVQTQCKIGYELNEAGDACVDVNECSRNTHKCNPSQICKNGEGYYTCECPPGHHLDPMTRKCEDIDECKFYKLVCSVNAACINTLGSYKCKCKEGFKEAGMNCLDIDECSDQRNLCDHKCINTWGSFRCACKPGFTLGADNRTCVDIDECEKFKDRTLCIGKCVNVPGSYTCACPDGYQLGEDERTCKDIDECEKDICARDDVCVNTKGSHKCYKIDCPNNYARDPRHKNKCVRPQGLCDPREHQCDELPEQYSYHFIELASKLPMLNERKFYEISGPDFAHQAIFNFNILKVNCPYGIQPIDESFIRKRQGANIIELFLVKSIEGPQEALLEVGMKLFYGNQIKANIVSRIYIIVSANAF